MLQGIVKVLLMYMGKGLIALGYGKAGIEARSKLGKGGGDNYICIVLSLVILGWICAVVYLFDSKNLSIGALVVALLIPALYVIWVVYARKAAVRFVAEVKKREQNAFLRDNIPAEVMDYCEQIAGDPEQLHDFIQKCLDMEILNLECAQTLWEAYTNTV